MNPSFDFSAPDRVTVGTVGEPGQRTFFVQAREGRQLFTLKVEKQQVLDLAEHLEEMLEDLAPSEPITGSLELEAPIEQDWIVGVIKLAPYDEHADRVHILFEEFVPAVDEEEPPPGASARVSLTRAQVVAFVQRAEELKHGGRETCVLCGNPKDPAGHACPRSNGHSG